MLRNKFAAPMRKVNSALYVRWDKACTYLFGQVSPPAHGMEVVAGMMLKNLHAAKSIATVLVIMYLQHLEINFIS